jgi:outer membrane protein
LRRYIILTTALILAAAAAFAHGADRLGYVNSEQLRLEYEGARDLENQLSASVADWRAQAQDMESQIEALINELRSQSLLLSDEASLEKEQVIQEKRAEYERFLNEVWGVGGLAARREAELWQPVIDRINAILNEIGADGGYLLIFDAAQMGIVYADPATDLTGEVLAKLNEGAE